MTEAERAKSPRHSFTALPNVDRQLQGSDGALGDGGGDASRFAGVAHGAPPAGGAELAEARLNVRGTGQLLKLMADRRGKVGQRVGASRGQRH